MIPNIKKSDINRRLVLGLKFVLKGCKRKKKSLNLLN